MHNNVTVNINEQSLEAEKQKKVERLDILIYISGSPVRESQ